MDEEFESRSREISLFHKAPTEYSLVDCLGDPSEIRMWGMSGLPNDEQLIQNALILIHCLKWPVLIDPQNKGREWIYQMEEITAEDVF